MYNPNTDRALNVSDVGTIRKLEFTQKAWGSVRGGVVGSFAAMVFGIAILVVSLLAATSPVRVVPNEVPLTASGSGKVMQVEYYLPYPGILPDSPLYKIKAARDRITLWLTTDAAKRAEKKLDLADKRINAAKMLVDGGKTSLGVSTATKAEKYLEGSARSVIKLSGEGKDVKSLLLRLTPASAKHAVMVEELMGKAEGEDRQVLEKTLKGTQQLQQEIAQALREAK